MSQETPKLAKAANVTPEEILELNLALSILSRLSCMTPGETALLYCS